VNPSRSQRYKWAILAMGCLSVFGALGLGRFGYASVLPAMQKGLGFSNTQAGALATWNLAGYVVMAVVAGALSARLGPRRVIPAGLLVAGVGMVLTGLAGGVGSAALARALTGLGAGATNVPAVAMMATWFSARRRGLASGFVVSGSSLALVIAGPTVPRLIAGAGSGGWRLCWYVFGAVTLVLAGAALMVLRDRPFAAGPAPAAAQPAPHAWRRILRSGYAWRLGIVYFAFGFSYMIYMTFFVKRLTTDAGYSSGAAGDLYMLLGWASLLCGVVWGYISDRIGRKFALAIVCLVHAVAFSLFAMHPTTFGLTASAVLFGLTAWSIPGIVGAACGDRFGPVLASTALGFLTVFLGVGQAIGPTIGGAMADHFASFGPSYWLAAGTALVGVIAALLMPALTAESGSAGFVPTARARGEGSVDSARPAGGGS
jgi:MFS family permease